MARLKHFHSVYKERLHRYALGGVVNPPQFDWITPPSTAATKPAGKVYADGGSFMDDYTPSSEDILPPAVPTPEPTPFRGSELRIPYSEVLSKIAPISWDDVKDALAPSPTYYTDKYGPSYAPIDAIRSASTVYPPLRGPAAILDMITDPSVHELKEFERNDYNPLRYGINAVDRLISATAKGVERAPEAIRATRTALDALGRLPEYKKGLEQEEADHLNQIGTGAYRAGYADGGRIVKFIKALRNSHGLDSALRAEKAHDLTDLSQYSDKGLENIFGPVNGHVPMAALPTDKFQDFSYRLGPDYTSRVPYGRFESTPSRGPAGGQDMNRYLDLMGKWIAKKGLPESPKLIVSKNLDDVTNVAGHNGRHRMLALGQLGNKSGLVLLPPARVGEGALLPRDERLNSLLSKYFPEGADTMVQPEGSTRDALPLGVEPFAGGGRKLADIGKAVRKAIVGALLPDADPKKPLYLRFGNGTNGPYKWPEDEQSNNWVTGGKEKGVSAYDLDPITQKLVPPFSRKYTYGAADMRRRWEESVGRDPAKAYAERYLLQGDRVGKGYDGEPVLKNLREVGTYNRPFWADPSVESWRSRLAPTGNFFAERAPDLEDIRPIPNFAGGGRKLVGIGKTLTQLLRDVKGKPSKVKIPDVGEIRADPLKEIEDVAAKFAAKQGNDYPITSYPPFDEDRARRIADAYEAMKHDPTDPAVKRAYDALISETMDQYKALSDAGIDFHFLRPGEAYPYAKAPSQGYLDMLRGKLTVFPTEQGFGTLNDISDNPLLTKVGPVGDLENGTANDAFRAVHDALGHFGPGNPFFRHKGEDRAFLSHSRSYSPDAIPAAASELRGQNSWLNFGPHGAANRTASEADTVFADQKTGLLPSWAWEDVLGRAHGFSDGGAVDHLPVAAGGIEWVKGLSKLFGKASEEAAKKVRQHTEQYGTEALSHGTLDKLPEELPFTPGLHTHVAPSDYDIRMLRYGHSPNFFSVHSHPPIMPSEIGTRLGPSSSVDIMDRGVGGGPHPSIGDLQWLQQSRPRHHTMMIEGAGAPNMRVAMQSRDSDEVSDAIKYLASRSPAMDYGKHMLGMGPAWSAVSKASKKFGVSPLDVSPLSGIWNEGIAKNSGMRVMMDPEGITSGGMTLKDLLPEYTKFLGSDMPESWKAEGGPIPGYAGGGRKITELATKAMKALKSMRDNAFDDALRSGASTQEAMAASKATHLPPDPRLQRNLVTDPLRIVNPGIYKDPRDIAAEAAALVEAKSPDRGTDSPMYKLFGVKRNDLYDIMHSSMDSIPSDVGPMAKPAGSRGSAVTSKVWTPANLQHQIDTLHESMDYENLFKPSYAWYESSPLWKYMDEKGLPNKSRLNAIAGIHSPGSDPDMELRRAMAANYFINRGQLEDYAKAGNQPNNVYGIPGHFAHRTAHMPSLRKYLAASDQSPEGDVNWNDITSAVKYPHYIAATDPNGPFLKNFVPDSHDARSLGYPDVRTATSPARISANMTSSEFWDALPHYQKMAEKLGFQTTPTQALRWNVFGPQTGVRSIGTPKLEILSNIIEDHANKTGKSLDKAAADLLGGADYPRMNYERGGDVDFDLYHVMNYAKGGRDADYDLYHLQDFWKK